MGQIQTCGTSTVKTPPKLRKKNTVSARDEANDIVGALVSVRNKKPTNNKIQKLKKAPSKGRHSILFHHTKFTSFRNRGFSFGKIYFPPFLFFFCVCLCLCVCFVFFNHQKHNQQF